MTTYNIDIQAKDGASSVLKSIQKNADSTSKSVGLLENAFKALAASATLKALVDASKAVDAISNKLAAITPASGKVGESFRAITSLANKFGESTSSLTEAFTLLGKAGISPTEQRLSQLAAIAAATGQTMGELADAIEEGVGGSFGKLQKRIDGLDIKQYGNTWVATLNGMKIASSTNAKDIVDSVLKIGDSAEMQRALLEKNKGLTASLTRLNNEFSASIKESGISQAFGSVVDSINETLVKSGALTAILKGIATVAIVVAENMKPILVTLGLITSIAIINGLVAVARGIQLIGVAAAFAKNKAGWLSVLAGLLTLVADKAGLLDQLFGGASDSSEKLDEQIRELTESVTKNNKGVDAAAEAMKNWIASISQAAGITFDKFYAGLTQIDAAQQKFAKSGDAITATNLLNWWEAINAEAQKLGIFFRTPLDIQNITAFRELTKEIVGERNEVDLLAEKLDILRNKYNQLNASSLSDMISNMRGEGAFKVEISGVANTESIARIKAVGDAIDQSNLKLGKYTGSVLTLEERLKSLTVTSQQNAKIFTEQKDLAQALRDEVAKGSMSWEQYAEAVKLVGSEHLPEASAQMNVLKSDVQVVADTIKTQMFNATEQMSRDILKAVQSGKNAFSVFKDFLGSLFNEIVTQLIKKQLVDPIALALNGVINAAMASAGGGGSIFSFFGSMFGGGRANGGPVASGTPYVVGERGPELFMPNSAGTIIPNDQLTMGNGKPLQDNQPLSVNFTINAIDTQTGIGFLMQNKPAIINMVSEAYNRRGRNGPLN